MHIRNEQEGADSYSTSAFRRYFDEFGGRVVAPRAPEKLNRGEVVCVLEAAAANSHFSYALK
jgi:hypothetical protein